jgi:hypothetical protein
MSIVLLFINFNVYSIIIYFKRHTLYGVKLH